MVEGRKGAWPKSGNSSSARITHFDEAAREPGMLRVAAAAAAAAAEEDEEEEEATEAKVAVDVSGRLERAKAEESWMGYKDAEISRGSPEIEESSPTEDIHDTHVGVTVAGKVLDDEGASAEEYASAGKDASAVKGASARMERSIKEDAFADEASQDEEVTAKEEASAGKHASVDEGTSAEEIATAGKKASADEESSMEMGASAERRRVEEADWPLGGKQKAADVGKAKWRRSLVRERKRFAKGR